MKLKSFLLFAILTALPTYAGTITGQLQGPSGLPVRNATLTFTLSQAGLIIGSGNVAQLTSQCYTASDGSIVGLPNPLISAISATGPTGTLPSGTYFIQYTFYNSSGESQASPESRIQTSVLQSIVVRPPVSFPLGATGIKVYIAATSGSETLQGTTTTPTGQYTQSVPLVAGAVPPITNNSICNLAFNDTIIPFSGYNVSLTSATGNAYPGWPQAWQLNGGANGTINVSQGAPLWNGTVIYPSPLLMQPLNHGPQSLGGSLNMSGYDLLNVGNLTAAGIASGSVNGIMFPAACANISSAPSWCSGSTADAWIRAACTQLPSSGGAIDFKGLNGTIAASAPCSTPTKQVIFIADNTSRLDITEADGGIPFPLDNNSMLLGQGAGQCNQGVGGNGIRLAPTANVSAIVGPAHTNGTQEDFTVSGVCLEGATGATITNGLIYSKATFVNTTISANNVAVCNRNCLKLENVGGIVEVSGNEFNVTDGDNDITGSAIEIASTVPSGGCGASSINIHGGNAEHANGGANFPEINIHGNGIGALVCSVYVHDLYTERNVVGAATPSTAAIRVQDCQGCSFSNIQGGGGSPVSSGDMINISQTGLGRVQNVTFNAISNLLGAPTWLNTINDTTPGGTVLLSAAVPFVATYFSNPGYQQVPVLPQSTLQSLGADLMGGQGNFSSGSGTFGTNFQAYGCLVGQGVTCTYTRSSSTAPPGYTFSQEVQITANTDPVVGNNGIEFIPSVSFTAGQTYQVTFWGKGDGTFTGLPAFILGDPTIPTEFCRFDSTTAFTATWTLYSASCTPSTSGTSLLSFSATTTPAGATGAFWLAGLSFSPVNPLTAGAVLQSAGPYGIGAIPSVLYSGAGTPVPTCNSGVKGMQLTVSDATSPTYLATYASGGSSTAAVICNGSNWVTH